MRLRLLLALTAHEKAVEKQTWHGKGLIGKGTWATAVARRSTIGGKAVAGGPFLPLQLLVRQFHSDN